MFNTLCHSSGSWNPAKTQVIKNVILLTYSLSALADNEFFIIVLLSLDF
jgi:hypothetical protein